MGLVKGAVRLGVGTVLFLAGYFFNDYVHHDVRYTIRRHDDAPYLEDRTTDERLVIDETTFQVGNLEYRLKGLLQDPRLPELLESIDPARLSDE